MFLNFKFFYIFLLIFTIGKSFPLKNQNDFITETTATNLGLTPPEIIKFMKRFGYLDSQPSLDLPDVDAIYKEDAISDAIKNIQKFGNINQTGILDNETLKLMTSPRCGVPDMYKSSNNNTHSVRYKRYVVGSQRWQKRNIKYFIANWSPKIGQNQVIRDMKRVFDIWASYSNLKFKMVNDNSADIIIAFGSRYHGDNYPFDGPGNILAHAFYPYEMQSYGGDIHFDNDENWKENSTNLSEGVDFFSVALHELGHSLGLAHSHVYSSIMFPYYKGPTQATLDYDDILAMYNLYVTATFIDDNWTTDTSSFEITTPKMMTTTEIPTRMTSTFQPTYEGDYETVEDYKNRDENIFTSTISPTLMQNISTIVPKILPNICDGHFDAVGVFRGNPYIFKGSYVWRLTDNYKIVQGYPLEIHQMFPFLPQSIDKIDAAYERNYDSAIILFTGNQYWVYNGYQLQENSPRPLSDYGIPQNISSINAAMYWPKNYKTYLFGSTEFWRYDDNSKSLDDGYPKSMSRWIGIPENIDAAATIPNGKTYFFKGNIYWLYNNVWIRPEPGYPRRASNAWLGCPLPQKRPYRKNNNYSY
ncbi:matrix metalloproteinase-2-like [Condylostylus longicornis]|uniref:matrix metalloproteinase-2-like n=1 Tax=Condylostylus longicornis TaxID=2530218 RepID=UPI00244DE74B|nr:matrix metalloproteinase-2-like [Condylostylus longicornis]